MLKVTSVFRLVAFFCAIFAAMEIAAAGAARQGSHPFGYVQREVQGNCAEARHSLQARQSRRHGFGPEAVQVRAGRKTGSPTAP